MKEKVIISGIIHSKFDELEDPHYYGGNLKPSEFHLLKDAYIGKDVFIEHTGKRVGSILNAYVSDVTGNFMGDLDIDLTTDEGIETIDKVRKGEMRELSFGAHVLRKKDRESEIVWDQKIGAKEVSIVKEGAVPGSLIKELKVINLDESGFETILTEVYNSKLKQENKMQTQQAIPPMQVDRGQVAPEDLTKIKMDSQPGGQLFNAIEGQLSKQLGVPSFAQQQAASLPPQAQASQSIAATMEESNKRQRLMEKEQELSALEQRLKKQEEEMNRKLKEDADKVKQLQDETRKIQLRQQNAAIVAKVRELFLPMDEKMQALTPEQQQQYVAFKEGICEQYAVNEVTPMTDAYVGTLTASMQSLQERNREAEKHNQQKIKEKEERDNQTKAALERQQQELAAKEQQLKLAASHMTNPIAQKSIYETLNKPIAPPQETPQAAQAAQAAQATQAQAQQGIVYQKENTMTTEMQLQEITASNLQRGHAAFVAFNPLAVWAENNPQGFANVKLGHGLTAKPYYTKGQLEDFYRRKTAV